MARNEIRLSGSGGQGMITAGIILAMAASVHEGKQAIQSQSYGPEARGGASKAEVIISDEAIYYPKVMAPDVLVALTQEAAEKYSKDLKEGGILILDELMVKQAPPGNFKVYTMDIIRTAADKVGKAMVANVVTLGALNTLCEFVQPESLEKAVLSRVPKGTEDLNKRALEAGAELAKAYK
ncbi:2-oxoacid:acceptor oxidoreductase family protein [Limisalsivibrio acetivorans]|uniref:2-oxoacid:acceptor oxidoreductase family protein n=1 Tax=Limisalsivibrio acetivorans TaxID=1304888 RepID=UPI0003B72463|nr:2-oxoacid:acceptor oxidoreductase family protein [Limisalsivibrio acetivorans]